MPDSTGLKLAVLARTESPTVLRTAVDQAIAEHAREDQHLDFKRIYTDNDELRKDVAAFANAEGGAIVVGVDTAKDESGADCASGYSATPLAAGFVDRAEQALAELAPFLRPLPRVVPVPGGPVVVIAVARTERLVPCLRKNRRIYYLRLGAHSLPMPNELVADLQLGRRQSPSISSVVRPRVVHAGPRTRIQLTVQVTVQGLTWVPAMQVGFVGHGHLGDRAMGGTLLQRANPAVLEGFSDRGAASPDGIELLLGRLAEPLKDVAPLAGEEKTFFLEVPLDPATSTVRVWRGAVFVVPSSGSGEWTQVHIEYAGGSDPQVMASEVWSTREPHAFSGTISEWQALRHRSVMD